MNPIYKFELSAGAQTRQAFPNYKDDLAIEYALEQNQEFYRGKLSGKLTFQQDDYTFIRTKSFDTQFGFKIYISYDAGTTWTQYWVGQFWKTDCEFNQDDETASVTPSVNDRYKAVLDGLDMEFNLIDLAPEIQFVKLDKRPMIQVYVPGQTVIGCFLSGMWWEQECEPESNETTLQTTYYFAKNKGLRIIDVSGTITPQLPSKITGMPPDSASQNYEYNINADYKLTYTWVVIGGGVRQTWEIVRRSDSVALWHYTITTTNPYMEPPYTITLSPVASGVSGNVTLSFRKDVNVFARYICDVESADEINTYPIPSNDICPDNRNYSRVVPYDAPETIFIWSAFVQTPTQWGLYQPGQYYANPQDYGITQIDEAFPIARAAWNDFSIWFVASANDWLVEQRWRKAYTLRDAFPLSSVISVLLGKVAPGISHGDTSDYSEFLYGVMNPITGLSNQKLLITPKSNIINAGYDQPAQKAPITLKNVLDMLRDCFRCYWFIDSDYKFRIEHISYFMNGGAYPGTPDYPVVGINLTKEIVTRNGKPWAFGRNQYQFEKPEMPARYQFGWMDDVTQFFDGYPIDILSKYVSPDRIENIDVNQFTSDVDYILLNPGEINKDGFVLLSATLEDGEYKLPYFDYVTDVTTHHYLQNGFLAFVFLQRYYLYDLPAPRYSINGEDGIAISIKKLKTQTINFPALHDPELMKLIKTELGDGVIQKISVNLSSRNANATLKYDTE